MKSQVLLPKIFNFPFTYNSRIENKIGNLVEVPFGSKKEIGVIWKNNYSEPENIKIKYINKRTEYSIDRKLIDFIEWFSTYNMVPIGLVLKMAIGGADNFIKNKDSSLEIKKTKKIDKSTIIGEILPKNVSLNRSGFLCSTPNKVVLSSPSLSITSKVPV